METIWNTAVGFVTDYAFAIMAILAIVCFVAFLFQIIHRIMGNRKYYNLQIAYKEYHLWAEKRIATLETDNELQDNYKEMYEKLCSATEDRIKIAENRTACAEGKLRKVCTKLRAMELATRAFQYNSKSLKETAEEIYQFLKEK